MSDTTPICVCIAIPQAVFDAHPVKVAALAARLWEGGDENPAPNAGWLTVEKITDPTKTMQLYVVTEQQIRKALDAAELARLKAILDDANILWGRFTDWQSELAARGWRLRQEANP